MSIAVVTDDELNSALLRAVNRLTRLINDLQTLTQKLHPTTPAKRTLIPRRRKDPNAPCSVRNAYTFFVQKMGKDMRKKNKSINQKHIIAEAGRLWNKMDDEEKAPFVELSEKDKKRYFAELEAYRLHKERTATQEEEDQLENEEGSDEESETEAVESRIKKSPSDDEDDESMKDVDDDDGGQHVLEEGQEELEEDEEEQRRHAGSGDSDEESLLLESHNKDHNDDEEQDSEEEKDHDTEMSQTARRSPASDKPSKVSLAKRQSIKEKAKPKGRKAADNLSNEVANNKGSGTEIKANGNMSNFKKANNKTTSTSLANGEAQEQQKKRKKRKNKNKQNKHQNKKHKPVTA